jgi:hypothetical protein
MLLPLLIATVCAAVEPPDFPGLASPLGETRLRVQRSYDRLLAPPLDDKEFVLSDLDFHFQRRFTEYSGDISGRMIGALHACGRTLGQQPPTLQPFLDALPGLQKKDGHFGAEQDLAKSVNQERDMPILWGNSRMLLALSELYRDDKNPRMLDIATRLGDYVVNTREFYGRKENFESVGGKLASGFTTCYPAFIDGMAALAAVTGDKKYLEETRFIADLSLADKEFEKHHSHGRLTAYRGMLDLNAITPVPDLLTAVVDGCKTIQDKYVLPTGGVQEVFDATYNRDEGCSEADWVRVNVLLWRATGDTAYLDAADHAIRNHMYGTQFFNGGFGHSFLCMLKDDGRQYLGGGLGPAGSDSYWCCSMHCAQVLADTVRWAFAKDSVAVYVTFLAESRAEFGDIKLSAERNARNQWKIAVDAPSRIALRLHVPAWAKSINVNGKDLNGENGWAEVSAEGKQHFDIVMPDTIRTAGPRTPQSSQNEPVRVFAGPDLYALPDCAIAEGFVPDDAVPRITVAAERPADGAIPVIVEGDNGRTQNAALIPISKRPAGGCRVLFKVTKVSADEFAKNSAAAMPREPERPLVRLAFCCSGHYWVYLNGKRLHEGEGWHESPFIDAYTAAPGANKLVVIATANQPKPGFIGQVMYQGKIAGTNPGEWACTAIEGEPTPELLAASGIPREKTLPLEEFGPFGTPPWNHYPAHFAKTPAKWLWPKNLPGKQRAVFLYTF